MFLCCRPCFPVLGKSLGIQVEESQSLKNSLEALFFVRPRRFRWGLGVGLWPGGKRPAISVKREGEHTEVVSGLSLAVSTPLRLLGWLAICPPVAAATTDHLEGNERSPQSRNFFRGSSRRTMNERGELHARLDESMLLNHHWQRSAPSSAGRQSSTSTKNSTGGQSMNREKKFTLKSAFSLSRSMVSQVCPPSGAPLGPTPAPLAAKGFSASNTLRLHRRFPLPFGKGPPSPFSFACASSRRHRCCCFGLGAHSSSQPRTPNCEDDGGEARRVAGEFNQTNYFSRLLRIHYYCYYRLPLSP